jgi:hypothetical protein
MCQAKAIYAQIIHRLIHSHPTPIRGRVSTAQGQAGFPHFKAQKRNTAVVPRRAARLVRRIGAMSHGLIAAALQQIFWKRARQRGTLTGGST